MNITPAYLQSSASNHGVYEPYLEEMREINKTGCTSDARCNEDEDTSKEEGQYTNTRV